MKHVLWICLLAVSSLFGQQSTIKEIDTHINEKQYLRAKQLLLTVSRKNPSEPIRERLADVYCHLKEWDNAIDLYEDLVETSPKNAHLHYKYGGAVARKAQNVSRVRALTLIGTIKNSFLNAAQLDNKHVEVRWGLIEYYLSVPRVLGGGISRAYRYADELMNISPIEGHFAKAYLLNIDGESEKANKHLKKTLPYIDNLIHVERNQLHFLIGKVCSGYEAYFDVGIAHMHDFIENHSISDGTPLSEAYYQLAKLYRLKKDKAHADFWIKKALLAKSDFALAHMEQQNIQKL